jgi:hypothetical protein
MEFIRNCPLKTKKLRWIAALASYDFSLTYMCGKSNTVADSLSRLDQDSQELFSDAVEAICDAILVSLSCPSAESILMSQSLDDLVDGNDLGLNELCDVSWYTIFHNQSFPVI